MRDDIKSDPSTPKAMDDRSLAYPHGVLLKRCEEAWMHYRPNDLVIGRALDCHGHYSPGEIRLFRSIVDRGDTVVEAGAGIGSLTIPLANSVGQSGTAYAFEPNSDSFDLLCRNLEANEVHNVIADHRALGATCEIRIIEVKDVSRPNNFGDTSLRLNGSGQTVALMTIDSLHLNRCDFVKADVQGMERDILLGAAETLSRFRPILYLENDQRELSRPLLATLEALGYDSYGTYREFANSFQPT
ncbi:FkbM family methyltransferase [Thalassoglobus sp. JC818]|uniref:FkbM family methyltransferase n=1 Tax=Thalassoglobus sp. JC818 TaxID=3232136 RepID=UPI00345747FE